MISDSIRNDFENVRYIDIVAEFKELMRTWTIPGTFTENGLDKSNPSNPREFS
jgi:hypothetical protein